MRLPEPSSSSGSLFASPVRSRDSLSSVQSLNSFLRPSVDFTGIFLGNSGPDVSAPIASESAAVSPAPSESTENSSQTDGDDETIQPSDEEEDEAVEANDSVTLEPLAWVVDAPITSDSPVSGADKQGAETAEQANDPQAMLPGATPHDSATATPPIAGSADETDSARSAVKVDAAEDVAQATETDGERATLAKPTSDVKKTSSAVAAGASETVSAESNPDQQTDRFASQIAADNRGEGVRRDTATDAALTAQMQSRNALAGDGQSTFARDGENGSSRNSGRHGRGRTSGTAAQKGRAAQAEAAARTRNEAATRGGDSAVDQAGTVDTSLAGGSTDAAAIADPGAVELPTTASETALFEDQVVAGPIAGGSEPAGLPLANGSQSSDLGAVGPTPSDDVGRSGDWSPARTDKNLSRTDIADRARLIHRISKAFIKMGTDGGQIRMKMHPETLGGVLLEMRVRGRNVEATVTADNEAARGVLQQQLSELRQRLESQGMTVQRLEVAVRDDSATGGSLLNDHRGEMFGGDRGSSGNGQSRRAPGLGNNAKRSDSSLKPGGGSQSGSGANVRSLSPAAPGTLDLRL